VTTDTILQNFHTVLDDLITRLAVYDQAQASFSPVKQRQALATMLTDHARECLELALRVEEP
jgi:hypothetical protein